MTSTITDIQIALDYLTQVVQSRLSTHFDHKKTEVKIPVFPIKDFKKSNSPLIHFIKKNKLNDSEIILLLMALAPHVQANFYEKMITETIPNAGNFPEFGGAKGKEFRGILPTGETVLFVLAGIDLEQRFAVQVLFSEDHLFSKKGILWLADSPEGEPRMCGKIVMSEEYVEQFCTGNVTRPRFSMKFPAQLVETQLNWGDLVLEPTTLSQIRELEVWAKHGDTLLHDWKMTGKIKPGYRVLFHGPPGTGKTLTASLLGKHTGKDVYKIDLSMVVSKFIGETEKNLSNLFAKAENKDWILFFDEADALFGKRTNVRDAHDKYANQEVSYLLQRVENYNGLVILASNFKNNIDEAFVRRFQSIIAFPTPKVGERLRLWQKAFPPQITLAKSVDLSSVAQKFELSGGEITNVVQTCCLVALDRGDLVVTNTDIMEGIRKEYFKEGRIMR